MSVLSGKKIVLGVTGGIAAYKTAYLVRELIKSGAEVQVVMSPAAKDFVTPLTLSTLSKRPVFSSFFDEDSEHGVWNNHVDLALWADYMIFAPLTANTMAKMVMGESDNLLMAVFLSAKCPIFIAPAMDLDMYAHPSTHENLDVLEQRDVRIIPPNEGELASGLEGKGRMAEPYEIVDFMENSILRDLPLYGKRVMITAGPTWEAIDPVRFLGNRSTGNMGYQLAEHAYALGAEVDLISGPVSIDFAQHKSLNITKVESAAQMFDAVEGCFGNADIAIFSAAVADYRPKKVAREKLKKQENALQIELERTKDILGTFGPSKTKGQLVIGFALETQDALAYAEQKRVRKNADLIVLNDLSDAGAGFGAKTNKITVLSEGGKKEFDLKSKRQVAIDIWDEILSLQV